MDKRHSTKKGSVAEVASPHGREFADHLVRLLFPEDIVAAVEQSIKDLSPEEWKALKAELISRWTSVRQTVLDFIGRREGQDLAINYIARGTKLSFRSVVNAIDHLVKNGLVVRTRRKASKRVLGYPYAPNRYTLTKKGRAKERPTHNKGAVPTENKEIPTENKEADLLNIFSKGKIIITSNAGASAPTLAFGSLPQGADAHFQRRSVLTRPNSHREHTAERARGEDVLLSVRRKQPASAATGKGRAREGKPQRTPKPETPEEKTVLDLYEQGIPQRCEMPDTWHDRGRSLRSLRRFEHKHPAVPLAVLLEYLKNAFDSDNLWPLKDDPFYLRDFLRNWQLFVNGPRKKAPVKKAVAQVIRERDRPLREDIAEFGEEWWQEVRVDHHLGEFEEFTRYTIDFNSDEVCLDFLAEVGWTWEKHMMDGSTVSPAMLMTKVIDACMQLPTTPLPSDFIPHRDRLRREA